MLSLNQTVYLYNYFNDALIMPSFSHFLQMRHVSEKGEMVGKTINKTGIENCEGSAFVFVCCNLILGTFPSNEDFKVIMDDGWVYFDNPFANTLNGETVSSSLVGGVGVNIF